MTNASGSSFGSGSLVLNKANDSFDVRREADVIKLLHVIHTNTIDPQIKNHLRDLIFAYRQSLSPEDGLKVEQSFATLGVKVVYRDAPTQAPVRAPLTHLGSARPLPKFVPIGVKVQQTAEPIVEHKNEVPPEQPVVVPETVPLEKPPIAATSASERIKEIKRIVNEKVGNPVNLIDAHNEIGREYMTALLDAMKKTNASQSGELEAAMARLEKAFAQVHEVVFTKPVVPVPEPVQAEAPKETVTPTRIPVVDTSTKESKDTQTRAPLTASGGNTVERPPVHMSPVSTHTPPETKTVAPQKEVPPAQPPESALHSVAKERQLQDLLRSNRQKEMQTKQQQEEAHIASLDPLQTPEVTAGLQQLLSEWALFKSSGIFGTGPNGKDHPLYKKLSDLTMAAVIAGRFEGATPAIKQSITDYMNGWRYEEGIVHEHMETFEHYLRKVVRHILNRKQQK